MFVERRGRLSVTSGLAVVLLALAGVGRAQVPDSSGGLTPLARELAGAQPAPARAGAIYQEDVFRYFDLSDRYPSPLQRAVFGRTPEYQTLLDSIRVLRRQLLARRWYVEYFRERPNDWSLSDYDLKAHGTWLKFHPGRVYSEYDWERESDVDYVLAPLPVTRRSRYMGEEVHHLLLPMSEESGLAVETQKGVRVYAVFSVVGFREGFVGALVTDDVRLIVGDKSTGDVYFARTYRKDH
jgi:hypothetical protein